MKRILFAALLLAFVLPSMAGEPLGIFVDSNTNAMQFINPLTMEVSPSLLKGNIGSYGGGLFDVTVTPNGHMAFISNFGDSTVYAVDISGGFNGEPTIVGYIDIPFFAEDMDVTPDGKFLLCTDGGFSSRCAVVDIPSLTLVKNANLGWRQAQAVAIHPSGKYVYFADYWNMAVHAFNLDAEGNLTLINTYYLDYNRPVNVQVSPDGKTLIAVCAVRYEVPVFAVNPEDGSLYTLNRVALPTKGAQSVVFSPDSSKAYYMSSSYLGGPRIHVLDITGPGEAAYSTSFEMSIPRGTSQLFGVDTIALDPTGQYLFVANPTLSGGVVEITVIETATGTEMAQLAGNGIPTGIKFTTVE